MTGILREIGRTVRAAMRSTPGTVRLCALIIVFETLIVVLGTMWFLLMLHQGV